ncbi:MAG: HNH endonuclease [Halioglobus sp.]
MKKVGVFARNHEEYLERAAEISVQAPSRLITFRSSKSWVAAKAALDQQKSVQAYFSPNGADGMILYEGLLKRIVLKPHKGDRETEAALLDQLPETVDETLWESEDGPVKTLYSVSHLKRLTTPYSMTELLKSSDGSPIAANYGYSYIPVIEREAIDSLFIHPDEIQEDDTYIEGSVRRMFVNAYERNPSARKACLAHYGFSCAVCGLSMEETYGEIGANFIHVHHTKPLATIGSNYSLNPITDLRPVCPNCHSMLHKRSPPFEVEELASLMKKKKI